MKLVVGNLSTVLVWRQKSKKYGWYILLRLKIPTENKYYQRCREWRYIEDYGKIEESQSLFLSNSTSGNHPSNL